MGAPGAGPARARIGPPASEHLQLPGTCPGSFLTCPVPAGPAGVSGRGHPPGPTFPSCALPVRLSGPPPRVSAGRRRSPPRRPRPVPTTHFLNPLQRHGSGRTRGHRPAGGGCGAGARGVVAGSARRLLGWLSAVGPGSPLAGSLPAPVPVPCAPERECARVCGRGRRRDSFVSAFASGKEPAPSPSAPHPAWHTGKCSSSPSSRPPAPGGVRGLADLNPAAWACNGQGLKLVSAV